MKIPNNPEAIKLLKLYEFHHLTSSYDRQELRKKFTAYNKANPTEVVQPAMILADRYPTFFKYVKDRFPTVPENTLFERNFGKLISNLHILPSKTNRTHAWNNKAYSVYESFTPSKFMEVYDTGLINFVNSISGLTYSFNHNSGMFESLDKSDKFSVYTDPNFLLVLREV